jgi:hypothetical protein
MLVLAEAALYNNNIYIYIYLFFLHMGGGGGGGGHCFALKGDLKDFLCSLDIG